MKICYLADAESVHTQKWVKYFADQGHEVHLISRRCFGGANLSGVELHLLKGTPQLRGMWRLDGAYTVIQIWSTIRRISPGILHAHFASSYGFWGALCCFHPFVLTAWGSDILVWPKRNWWLRWKVKFALRKADLITCDADHMIERMVELGAAREKIRLNYFGIDTQKFNPKRRDDKFKEELQLGSDSPTIISLRGLRPIYDAESLIKAVPLVLNEVPGAKFIIAGDGEQRGYLEDLGKSLGVLDNIKFVGFISQEELPRYLASVDVYVSTALSDGGLAASTAEAMASELPVVITDFGDNRKWVKDGEGGCIVPPKNPTVLSERIIYLLKNEDVRRRLGKINRRVIEERNNYDKEMGRMEHTYKQLMKGHTR